MATAAIDTQWDVVVNHPSPTLVSFPFELAAQQLELFASDLVLAAPLDPDTLALKLPHASDGGNDVVMGDAFSANLIVSGGDGSRQPHQHRRSSDCSTLRLKREQHRKIKQRCYEKSYRHRKKDKRSQEEVEWIQLEVELRRLLRQRVSLVADSDGALAVRSSTTTVSEAMPASVARLETLRREKAALRLGVAFFGAVLSRKRAMDFWGAQTVAGRSLRQQINEMPDLESPRALQFEW